jgi:hypothetical protein
METKGRNKERGVLIERLGSAAISERDAAL